MRNMKKKKKEDSHFYTPFSYNMLQRNNIYIFFVFSHTLYRKEASSDAPKNQATLTMMMLLMMMTMFDLLQLIQAVYSGRFFRVNKKGFLRPKSLIGSGSSAWKKYVGHDCENQTKTKKESFFEKFLSHSTNNTIPITHQTKRETELWHMTNHGLPHPWKIRASLKKILAFLRLYTTTLLL